MSLCKCLLSASLVSLALPAAHGEAHCPGNVASLPLRVVQSSLIVVPIEINHSGPYDFVVDTGAQVSTIEPALASELRLKVEGTTGVGGVATYGRNAYAYLDLIAAGDHSVSNTIVVLQELDQLKAADSRIRGILGANFLENFDMLIDNRQHILCLDSSGMLARAVKGEHFALAEPRGSQTDLPFTRPIVVAVRLSDLGRTSVILRLDSGSNVPLLYAADQGLRKSSANSSPLLKRVVNGVEQVFALLPPQNIEIGKGSVRQVSFVMPLNPIGGGPVPREDGLLPTMVFQRVFVSPVGRYATLDPW